MSEANKDQLTKKNMEALKDASGFLRILGNPKRLEILCYLEGQELTVTQLMQLLGMGQSALSQQLGILKETNLVTFRREHNKLYYSLSSELASEFIALLRKRFCES